MISCGTDIVLVERIKKCLENPKFLEKYFSKEEREYFKTKKEPLLSVAATFAGKEAFSKALGTGVRGFSLNEVSVLRNEMGAPYLSFSGKALKIVRESGKRFEISLSHEKEYALAFVVACEE